MKMQSTRRSLYGITLAGFLFCVLLSLLLSQAALQQQSLLQAGSFNRHLETFDSGLNQLAAFLAEPGDLGDDAHLVRRLNRFVYGNAGIQGIELTTVEKRYQSSTSPSGQYVSGGIRLPICKTDKPGPFPGKNGLLVACEDTHLLIDRAYEDFEGKVFSLRLTVNPVDLPGGQAVKAYAGIASDQLRCGVGASAVEPCSIIVPGIFSKAFISEFFPRVAVAVLILGVLILVLIRLVVIPVRTLNRMIVGDQGGSPGFGSHLEQHGILRLFKEPVVVITELLRVKTELEQKSAAATARDRVADEVVHNIRSPLAALHGVESDLGSIPEDARVVFRSAVTRIEDTINLLDVSQRASNTTPQKSQKYLISSLVSVLLSEKRRQYMDRQEIEFTLNGEGAYGLFAEVDNTTFKTVLSNLINNAVEAIPPTRQGKIVLTLRAKGPPECEIVISDNGIGMDPVVQERATSQGYTYGKSQGKGLGLYHAKTVIESWSGKISVSSELGSGTSIVLTLPITSPPNWFLPALPITKGETVGVLDDDPSIHHLWKNRLSGTVSISHFQTGKDLERAVRSGIAFGRLLIDYELIGEKETGIDLIRRLGIAHRSVLVTSRFEDDTVRSACGALGIKLLPKGLASQVPICFVDQASIDSSTPKNAVLLDNDPLILQTWARSAEKAGIKLSTFATEADLFFALSTFPTSTPIYLDLNLGSDHDGIQIATRLHELGYGNLFLATGAEARGIPTWLKRVGKRPPFKNEDRDL